MLVRGLLGGLGSLLLQGLSSILLQFNQMNFEKVSPPENLVSHMIGNHGCVVLPYVLVRHHHVGDFALPLVQIALPGLEVGAQLVVGVRVGEEGVGVRGEGVELRLEAVKWHGLFALNDHGFRFEVLLAEHLGRVAGHVSPGRGAGLLDVLVGLVGEDVALLIKVLESITLLSICY